MCDIIPAGIACIGDFSAIIVFSISTAMRSLASQAAKKPSAAGDAWRAAADKIRGFADLKQNWDFDGGRAPSRLDIDNAVHALESIQADAYQAPHVSAAGDGEIGLEWDLANEGYIDISLHNGKLIYISRSPDGRDFDDEYEYRRDAGVKASIRDFIREQLQAKLPA